MKKHTLPILGTLALTLSCSSVFAVDGTLTVNGVVTDGTCTLLGNSGYVVGLKDLTINLGAMPKSWFAPAAPLIFYGVYLNLKNATGTGNCDLVTTQVFKGIHLSVSSPDHLDASDKTLLVNQATDASTKNPFFIQMRTNGYTIVDFSEPWGTQAKSPILTDHIDTYLYYIVLGISKTGVVDAQNYTAKINYTLMYN